MPHHLPAHATSCPKPPAKPRKRAANPVPLSERLLIELPDAARLLSVSHRSAKRLAAEHPELTCRVGRRRLFVRAKLLAFIDRGGL